MWRRLWSLRSADAEETREMERQLVTHFISGGIFLSRLLGDRTVGIVLLEAYLSDNPEVTADYVSARLEGYLSPDTARRRLKEMVKARTVTTRNEGRTVLFTLKPEVAEAAIAYLKGEPIKLPDAHVVNY